QERVRLGDLHRMKTDLRTSGLHTVCEEARCPNRTHCFALGTATFLLMGGVCTRACGFCSIQSGQPEALNPLEPQETAERVAALNLRFAVLTSVNWDDLPDGGAAHFAETILAIRRRNPGVGVEVLVPDFLGDLVYKEVRPAGRFERSLAVLRHAKTLGTALYGPGFRTKSGLMLGLGETEAELLTTFQALVDAGVDILTLGQYLRPTRHQLPVKRYVPPEEFDALAKQARALGFRTVHAGPLVRSSYHAEEVAAQG
ncbi:MAG: lipoyl synthase, partial [Acidobacteria bacterium]|nr:lipoyl synthase [Acidobacteriota bacterium]